MSTWTDFCAAQAAAMHAYADYAQKRWDAERAYAVYNPDQPVDDSHFEGLIESYTANALQYERLAKGENK
jgi:hypothetical protein